MESKIREAYGELVDSLAETAKSWLSEKGYNYTKEEAVRRSIDDQLIYNEDRMVVLGHAYSNGIIEWGKAVDWVAIDDFLFECVLEELGE